MNLKDILRILLSIIIGFYIGKFSYDSFSDNIILIRL
jgi:hypothetical protein